jgi:serine/threonine protein kinase
MAPEVLLGKEYNEKCDIWSTGILMYLMITGLPAFFSKDRDETIKLITEGKLEFNRIC